MPSKEVRRAYRLLTEAVDPDTSDPWWRIDEAKDELESVIDEAEGLVETPENAVALADGRTPEEAEAVREEVEESEWDEFTDGEGPERI